MENFRTDISLKTHDMAEIEAKRPAKKKKRFNKRSTRVDLTPMVDLGFLLITFFVFTTTMAALTAMKVEQPYDKVPPGDEICESCVLTVLLEKNNRIKYYEGAAENNPPLRDMGYSPEELREVLMQKKTAVEKLRGTDQFILIIKPTAESSFKNFVDITDEATICRVKRYYIDELKGMDRKLQANKN